MKIRAGLFAFIAVFACWATVADKEPFVDIDVGRVVAKDTDGKNKKAQAELRALKAAYLEKDPSAMKS